MESVRIHIPLAPDLRGRAFAATGVAAPKEWVVAVDPRDLERAERVHLLRMADSEGTWKISLYDTSRDEPPREVWVGTYVPVPTYGYVRRETWRLSLDARGDDDRVVVAAALAALGAADEERAADVDAAVAAAAAIRADRLRWEAAQAETLAALNAAVDAWLVQAEDRAADLRARGVAALTPREIQFGFGAAPRKPSWFDEVVAAGARGERLAAAWDALSAAWKAAYAQVVAERDAQERAVVEEARAAQERRQAEMTAWIAQHGSDRLRALLADGYPVWSAYVRERAAREFPGFAPDLTGSARWRELQDTDDQPTDAQIALARRVGGRARLLLCDHHGNGRNAVAVVVSESESAIGVTLIEAAADARDEDDE